MNEVAPAFRSGVATGQTLRNRASGCLGRNLPVLPDVLSSTVWITARDKEADVVTGVRFNLGTLGRTTLLDPLRSISFPLAFDW